MYKNNSDIVGFYKQLGLMDENKRIEYLILEIRDFCEKYCNDSSLNKLKFSLDRLREKWNQQS